MIAWRVHPRGALERFAVDDRWKYFPRCAIRVRIADRLGSTIGAQSEVRKRGERFLLCPHWMSPQPGPWRGMGELAARPGLVACFRIREGTPEKFTVRMQKGLLSIESSRRRQLAKKKAPTFGVVT